MSTARIDQPGEPDSYVEERERMVRNQIAARDVTDPRVLAAMREVPRHLFIPHDLRHEAYYDQPVPIGEGQTISQPYIVAKMTELLCPRPTDRVLEVGTGSGYQTAVLASLVEKVYTVELSPSLSATARETLQKLGYTNIEFRVGDGHAGWPEEAPFDGILVACAPARVPPELREQMAHRGRMVIPVGGGYGQQLMVVERSHDRWNERPVIPVRFVPMRGRGE